MTVAFDALLGLWFLKSSHVKHLEFNQPQIVFQGPKETSQDLFIMNTAIPSEMLALP